MRSSLDERASTTQTHSAIAAFMTRTNWRRITCGEAVAFGNDPEVGELCTGLIKYRQHVFFGEIDAVPISRARPLDLSPFFPDLPESWVVVREEACSLALTSIDPAKIKLVSMIEPGDLAIDGEMVRQRVLDRGWIPLDAKILQVFRCNPHLIPSEWKLQYHGSAEFHPRISFDGTEVLRKDVPKMAPLTLDIQLGAGSWATRVKYLSDSRGIDEFSAVLVP